MPTRSPVVARPTTKAEATRIILARDPEMDDLQLQAALKKEFRMQMSKKQAYNYRRTALEKLNHPSRPARPSSNGAPVAPAPSADLAELIRIGNALGWERVKEVAEIAVQVRK